MLKPCMFCVLFVGVCIKNNDQQNKHMVFKIYLVIHDKEKTAQREGIWSLEIQFSRVNRGILIFMVDLE